MFYFFAVLFMTCLAASSTSSENSRTNLIVSAAKPKYAGCESVFTKVKFSRFAGSSTLPDETVQTEASAPLRKTKSDSLPRRIPRATSHSLSPSDEEISPLHSVVEPRPFLLTDSPKSVRHQHRGSKMPRDSSTRSRYDGMTREELIARRTERKMQYLYAKAQYSKAKFEYHDIKNFILDNQL